MACDMCGSEEQLYRCRVEDTVLNVCKGCSSYGEVVGKESQEAREKTSKKAKPKKQPEIIEVVREDYSNILKNIREKKGLKQEELAKKLAEKASLIQNLESGHMKPSIPLAKKLEKFFNINLIESYEEKQKKEASPEGSDEKMTIGDMIKIKKR